jgi:type I site-specific restriction endonuclease
LPHGSTLRVLLAGFNCLPVLGSYSPRCLDALAILDLVVGTNLNSKKTRIVKDIPKVKKAVNSNIRHASDQAVIRKIFLNKKTADLKLKELTKKNIKKWISKRND